MITSLKWAHTSFICPEYDFCFFLSLSRRLYLYSGKIAFKLWHVLIIIVRWNWASTFSCKSFRKETNIIRFLIKKGLILNSGAFLCELCMFSPCLWGFFSDTPAFSHSHKHMHFWDVWIGYFKLTLGMNVSVKDCLSDRPGWTFSFRPKERLQNPPI